MILQFESFGIIKRLSLAHKEVIFFFNNKSHRTLEELAQRSCGCPIPENVPGQAG